MYHSREKDRSARTNSMDLARACSRKDRMGPKKSTSWSFRAWPKTYSKSYERDRCSSRQEQHSHEESLSDIDKDPRVTAEFWCRRGTGVYCCHIFCLHMGLRILKLICERQSFAELFYYFIRGSHGNLTQAHGPISGLVSENLLFMLWRSQSCWCNSNAKTTFLSEARPKPAVHDRSSSLTISNAASTNDPGFLIAGIYGSDLICKSCGSRQQASDPFSYSQKDVQGKWINLLAKKAPALGSVNCTARTQRKHIFHSHAVHSAYKNCRHWRKCTHSPATRRRSTTWATIFLLHSNCRIKSR